MNKFKKQLSILLSLLMAAPAAYSAPARSDNVVQVFNRAEGAAVLENYMKNQSYDVDTFGATKSAGTIDINTSAPIFGKGSLRWSPAGAGNTLKLRSKVLPSGLNGLRCTSSIFYKLPYMAGVEDVAGRLNFAVKNSAGATLVASNGLSATFVAGQPDKSAEVQLTYACPYDSVTPANSYIDLEVTNVKAYSTAIFFDEVWLTKATNIGSAAPSSFFFGGAEQAGAASCTYSQNTSSGDGNFIDLGTSTGCAAWTSTGKVTTVGTNDHRITLTGLKAGVYAVNISGNFVNNASGTCSFRLSDGTNTYQPQAIANTATGVSASPNLTFSIPYSTEQSSITLKLQASDNQASGCSVYNGANFNMSWRVNYFPTSQMTSTVITPDQMDYGRTPYAPTIVGLGTISNMECFHDRTNGFLNLECKFTSTTPTATEARLPLPAGLTMPTWAQGLKNFGSWGRQGTATAHGGFMLASSGAQYLNFSIVNTYGAANINAIAAVNGNDLVASGESITLSARIPIAGWDANGGTSVNIDGQIFTQTRYLSGSGTYNPPSGVKYIEVEMVGAGAGGSGSGQASGGLGGAGGNTTFGTSLLTATGGGGSLVSPNVGGLGGTATVNSPATTLKALSGAIGGGGGQSTASGTYIAGGGGGSSPFGGAGGGGPSTTVGTSAAVNSGSGGGGAGSPTGGSPSLAGGGGGSGGYLKARIVNPAASYSYAVGAAGTAGVPGSSGASGGTGGSGIIIITEYYNSVNALPAEDVLKRVPGGVTSDSSNKLRFESAYIANNGTCSVTTSTSSFLTSPTRPGTGRCNFAFVAGTWSTTPHCVLTPFAASANTRVNSFNTLTASAVEFTRATAGANEDGDQILMCIGFRP